ncbi:MAG: DUF4115 domain-containing protein [Magnetococcales bacterium]|nr:DUF4115 domain-containing protein [Magnetococcales bacterium]
MIGRWRQSAGKAATTKPASGESATDAAGFEAMAAPPASGLNIAQQVGQFLRQTRESKGITLEEASRQTRVRIVHLRAIEEGEIGSLPGPAFVVGFLRLYVKFLQVPEKETVDRFVEQWHHGEGFLATQFFPPPHNASRSRPSVWMVILGMAGLVALVVWYSRVYPTLPLFGMGHGGAGKGSIARAVTERSQVDDAATETADMETETSDDRLSSPGASPFASTGAADVQGVGEEDDNEPGDVNDTDEEGPDHRLSPPGGARTARPEGATTTTGTGKNAAGGAAAPTRSANGSAPTPGPVTIARRPGSEGGESKPGEVKPVVPARPGTEMRAGSEPKPTSETRPGTIARLVGEPRPGVEVKVAIPLKPGGEIKPVTEVKPGNETKPVVPARSAGEVKPVAEVKPNGEIKPVIPGKPVVEVKPNGEIKPVIPGKPVVEVKPVAEVKPNGETRPVIPAKPVVEVKPMAEVKPNGETRPVIPAKPVVEVKPMAEVGTSADTKPGLDPRSAPTFAGKSGERVVATEPGGVSDLAVPGGGGGRVATEKIKRAPPPGTTGGETVQASGPGTSGQPLSGRSDVSVSAPEEPAPGVDAGSGSGSGSGSRVVLVATAEAWIAIQNPDGRQIKNHVMKPGERYEIPADGRYSAQFGNAGGVQVLVDGRSLPPLGRRGEVLRHVDMSPRSLLERFRMTEAPE